MTWLIVGLGNPGPKYAMNRHNIGFMVVEELARRAGTDFRDKFKGRHAKGRFGTADAHLLMPQTYMNLSGVSVGLAASFFKIPQDRTLVIHDELDLPYGQLRLKIGGGHAGHNGLRSIFQHLGKDFVRLRCGIGRPAHGDVAAYVLSNFVGIDAAQLDDVVYDAANAIERALSEGPLTAMNTINQK